MCTQMVDKKAIPQPELQFAEPKIVYENTAIRKKRGFYAVITADLGLYATGEIRKDSVIFAGDTTTKNYGIYVARHNNSNQFVLEAVIEQPFMVRQLTSVDLDGDGLLDLIITGARPAVRYISNFNIHSSNSDVRTIYNELGGSHASFVVDINNDGIMDLISGISTRNVTCFPGSQVREDFVIGGSFEVLNDDICGIHDILAVDLDGDGFVEIITGGDNFPLSFLKKQKGSSKWEVHLVDPADEYLVPKPGKCYFIKGNKGKLRQPGTRYYCAADFNGDGIMDLAATFKWPVSRFKSEAYSESLLWYPGKISSGKISFGPKNYLIGAKPNDGKDQGMFGLTCADFDGDGNIDIVATNRKTSQILLIKNHGKGRFGYPKFVNLLSHGCKYLDQITHGDLNGDGKQDLVAVCKKSAQVL